MALTLPPTFLSVSHRPAKPRRGGLTHVLDKGCTLASLTATLSSVGDYIDVWKFGWGTAYVDRAVFEKVDALLAAGVKACTGGTLLEIAWLQDRTTELFAYAGAMGFDCVEVSNGATHIPPADKRALIGRARDLGFEVLAEVGSKDPERAVDADEWTAEVEADIAAGATWVVAEGRESGTVGLYDGDGAVRRTLVDALARLPDAWRIIYEAPQRSQQAYLLREFGPEVSLGNVAVDDIMSVEAMRLGLRADTIGIGTRADRSVGVRG